MFLMTGCSSTARVNQFQQFAEAGMRYADSVGTLTEAAGKAAIDADSMVLAKTRPKDSEKRALKILEHNKLMKERLSLLGNVRRHALLLKSYFASLASLASSDAPSGIGTATEGLVDSMGQLSGKIKKSKVGDLSVSQFSGKVVTIAVANFRRAALEKELKARAPVLEQELDIQQAALRAIADQIKIDLQANLQQMESKEVVLPYRNSKSLSSSWSKKRYKILTTHISLASAEAAADAAKRLKLSFVALLENRFGMTEMQALIKDIDEIISLVEAVKGADAKG
jgi:hypothetical protein